MTGRFPIDTFETLGLCKHGVPMNFGCSWCCQEDENISPIIKEVQILADIVRRLEERIEKLENGNES